MAAAPGAPQLAVAYDLNLMGLSYNSIYRAHNMENAVQSTVLELSRKNIA